ncbi:MAG TPA: hypothetical protein VMU81_04410 [Acetobacteraceae bacterium]|nr:hypothetical protein [Acetobacteraceae bacterium]
MRTFLRLGAVVASAVGKFPCTAQEEMFPGITRHIRFTAQEFQVLATEQPIDVPTLHRRIHSMIEDAEDFMAKLPRDAAGVVSLDGGKTRAARGDGAGQVSAPSRRAGLRLADVAGTWACDA